VTTAEVLFAEHRQRLFLYFCRAVGHPETAHDLTQDVFLRVTRSGPPAVQAGELRPWLFRIARNLALDHHKRLERHPDERAGHALPAETAAAVGRTPRQETTVAINEALAALEELDRDVFLMREVAGLSYHEIAQACELTTDAVRSRIHRTRLRLRDHLQASIHDVRVRPLRLTGAIK
jgi:RNA polymerase sigma-70 factor (ECF subfamily)